MSFFDFLWHLLNFIAPAFGVAAIMGALTKSIWRSELRRVSWWGLTWRAGMAGLAVLACGLVVTGHDGRMVTYAGLVLACAVVPWWSAMRG